MARPIKEGLDYFPLDTDIIHDLKIRKIMRSNGPQAIAVLLDLLGNIYGDHGYYMQWDDDVRFLIADDVGISEAAVDEMVKKAVQVDFFNKKLFDKFSILTSKGIQKRYQKASKRKTSYCIQKRYSLVVNVHNNSVNVDKNPRSSEVNSAKSTQSKVKESKGNKSKADAVNPFDASGDQKDQQQHPLAYYQEAFGQSARGDLVQHIEKLADYFGNELVNYAIKIAVTNGNGFSYANGIMKSWYQDGIKTLADAKRQRADYQHKKQATRKLEEVAHEDEKVTKIHEWAEKQKKEGEPL